MSLAKLSMPIVLVIVISSFSGCTLFNNTTISLISSTVIDDEGFATLSLQFNASNKILLTLSGPLNDILFSDTYYHGESEVEIHLAPFRDQPLPGEYKLLVYDEKNTKIFEKKFVFEGENLSIFGADTLWSDEDPWNNLLSLVGVNITVTNFGDLPAYPYKAKIRAGNTSSWIFFTPEVVLPEQSRTLCCFVYIEDVSSELQNIEILMKDSEDNLMASGLYPVVPAENLALLKYRWTYISSRYLQLPNPQCLYEYYNGLDRLPLEDYAAYIFDKYDEYYFDIVANKFSDLFESITNNADKINAIASFIQNMRYVEDDPNNASYEYPQYPIELLKEEQGDCEDTAILTATILDKMGYNVSLLRLPNHMAVGVHLSEDATTFDYYVDEYYYLETTRTNWVVGKIPSEYSDLTNVTVYPISSRPILIHKWKNATRYTTSDGSDFVDMRILVENFGSSAANDIEVRAAFYSEFDTSYNQVSTVISSLSAGERTEVQLQVNVPQGIETSLKSHIYLDDVLVNTKESTQIFS